MRLTRTEVAARSDEERCGDPIVDNPAYSVAADLRHCLGHNARTGSTQQTVVEFTSTNRETHCVRVEDCNDTIRTDHADAKCADRLEDAR